MTDSMDTRAERSAEQARHATGELAGLTLSTIEETAVPPRVLRSLTEALSHLSWILEQLGEWHQERTDRATPRAAAWRAAVNLYEASRIADVLYTQVGAAWADSEQTDWLPDLRSEHQRRLPPPSSFGRGPGDTQKDDPGPEGPGR